MSFEPNISASYRKYMSLVDKPGGCTITELVVSIQHQRGSLTRFQYPDSVFVSITSTLSNKLIASNCPTNCDEKTQLNGWAL